MVEINEKDFRRLEELVGVFHMELDHEEHGPPDLDVLRAAYDEVDTILSQAQHQFKCPGCEAVLLVDGRDFRCPTEGCDAYPDMGDMGDDDEDEEDGDEEPDTMWGRSRCSKCQEYLDNDDDLLCGDCQEDN